MLFPIIIIIFLFVLSTKKIQFIKLFIFFIVSIMLLFLLMLYGCMRTNVDYEQAFRYFIAELFPEFRGAVGATYLNTQDLTFPISQFIFSMCLPRVITDILGINKQNLLFVGKYVAELLGYDSIGIRISFTGELLLCNIFFFC